MNVHHDDDTELALEIQRLVHGKILEGTTLHKHGSFVVTVDVEMFMSLHKLLDPSFQYVNEEDMTYEVISRSLRSLANVMDKETGGLPRWYRSNVPNSSGICLASANTLPSNVALFSQPSYKNCPPLILRPTLEDNLVAGQVASTPSAFTPVDKEDHSKTLADIFRDISELSLPDMKTMLSNIVSCTRSSQTADNLQSSSCMVNVSDLITNYIIEYGIKNQPSSARKPSCRFCSKVYSDEKGSSCCFRAANLRKVAEEWQLLRRAPFHQGFVKWDALAMANILDDFQSHIGEKKVAKGQSIEPQIEDQNIEQNDPVMAKKHKTRKRRLKAKHNKKIRPYDHREEYVSFKEVAEIPSGESEHEIRVTNFCQLDGGNPQTELKVPENVKEGRPKRLPQFITPALRPATAVQFHRAPRRLPARPSSQRQAMPDESVGVLPSTTGGTSWLTECNLLIAAKENLLNLNKRIAKSLLGVSCTVETKTSRKAEDFDEIKCKEDIGVCESVVDSEEGKEERVPEETREQTWQRDDVGSAEVAMKSRSSRKTVVKKQATMTLEGKVVGVQQGETHKGTELCGQVIGSVDGVTSGEVSDEEADLDTDDEAETGTEIQRKTSTKIQTSQLQTISESQESLDQITSLMQSKRRTSTDSFDLDPESQRTSRASRKNSTQLPTLGSSSRRSKRILRNKPKPRRAKPLDEQMQLNSARQCLVEVFRRLNMTHHNTTINSMIVELQVSPPADAAKKSASECETVLSDDARTENPEPSRTLPCVEAADGPSEDKTLPSKKEGPPLTPQLQTSAATVVKLLHAIARFIQSKRTSRNYDCWFDLRELFLNRTVRPRLSDKIWINLSKMLFPELRGMTKHITYQAIPAHPHFCWFRQRTEDEVKVYPDGNQFSVFYKDGSGKIFYPDGVLAIDFITKERGSRYMVYSPAIKHVVPSLSTESVLVGMFDVNGNGVIYDTHGCVRLHYTQSEGVMLDSTHGMPVVWTWPVNYVQEDPAKVLTNELFYMAQDPDQIVCPDDSEIDLPIFPDIADSKKSLVDKISKANKRAVSSTKFRRANMSSITTMGSLMEKATPPNKEDLTTICPDVTDDDEQDNSTERVDSRESTCKSAPVRGSEVMTRPTAEVTSRARSGDSGSVSADEKWKEVWLPLPSEEEVYESDRNRVTRWKSLHLRPEMCAHYPQIPLKINDFISFRLSGQADVALIFSAEKQYLRIELGVVINPTVKLRVDICDSKSWPKTRIPQCSLERFPPTKSLAKINDIVEERRRKKQERDAKQEALERRLGLRM